MSKSQHQPRPALNIDKLLKTLRAEFRAAGTAERAVAEKAYLKSSLRFHGVTVPFVRKVAKDTWRAHAGMSRTELLALTKALFASDYHDLRSLAIALLELGEGELSKRDVPWLLSMVSHTGNWAHVDWLATKVIGHLIAREPSLLRELPRWARSEDFWVRRTALLAQHDELRAGRGDFDLFATMAQSMLHEKEFFIRKAIGWVLREVSKKRPMLVKAFVSEHGKNMSGLSLREATRRMK